MRTLIDEIIVDLEQPKNEVVLVIHWAGGHHTELRVPKRWRKRQGPLNDLKAIVRTLRKVLSDEAIAQVLNREKLGQESGETWTFGCRGGFRRRHRIPAFSAKTKQDQGWLTQAEAATRLDISPMSMTRLVKSGIIPAEQPRRGLPTVIKQDDLTLDRVQRAVSQLKTSNNRPLSDDPNQFKLFETSDS